MAYFGICGDGNNLTTFSIRIILQKTNIKTSILFGSKIGFPFTCLNFTICPNFHFFLIFHVILDSLSHLEETFSSLEISQSRKLKYFHNLQNRYVLKWIHCQEARISKIASKWCDKVGLNVTSVFEIWSFVSKSDF